MPGRASRARTVVSRLGEARQVKKLGAVLLSVGECGRRLSERCSAETAFSEVVPFKDTDPYI
jgi:hypothetical protein